MKAKYWIELVECSGTHQWRVKCINGRVKAYSNIYGIFSLCFNDAIAFADSVGLQIRKGK